MVIINILLYILTILSLTTKVNLEINSNGLEKSMIINIIYSFQSDSIEERLKHIKELILDKNNHTHFIQRPLPLILITNNNSTSVSIFKSIFNESSFFHIYPVIEYNLIEEDFDVDNIDMNKKMDVLSNKMLLSYNHIIDNKDKSEIYKQINMIIKDYKNDILNEVSIDIYSFFPNILPYYINNLYSSEVNDNIKNISSYYIMSCDLYMIMTSYLSNSFKISVFHNKFNGLLYRFSVLHEYLHAKIKIWFINKQHNYYLTKYLIKDSHQKDEYEKEIFNGKFDTYDKKCDFLNIDYISHNDLFDLYIVLIVIGLLIIYIIQTFLIWMFCSCSKNKKIKYKKY